VFKDFGYAVLTGIDSSHQNWIMECSPGHIGDALCAKLTGANLDACFWPHAFKDYLHKHNAIRHPSCPSTTQICMISAYLVVVLGMPSGKRKGNFSYMLAKASLLAT
jgi:hypothetical protein